MGRPINKRYFGALTGDNNNNIPVEGAFIDGEAVLAGNGGAEVFIVKQKSARRFLVQSADTSSQAVCRLVDKAGSGDDSTALGLTAGEMVIIGYVDGAGAGITIRSMTNRVATDFNSNRYTWEIEDDSTTTQLILTRLV
jgi:hypothetical protein